MGKREAVALLSLVAGVLLLSSVVTVPVGVLLVGAGAYLLVLPYVGPHPPVEQARGRRGRI
jgi:hypothetical protein